MHEPVVKFYLLMTYYFKNDQTTVALNELIFLQIHVKLHECC
jgi:hypothetical protein